MEANIVEISSTSRFNWTIENFSKLNVHNPTFSDVFSVGSFKWKAAIVPKGWVDSVEWNDHVSLYLSPVDLKKSVDTDFSFAITNQTDPSIRVRRELKYSFPGKWPFQGWKDFMSLDELYDPGYIMNDTCIIEVEVSCRMKDSKDDDDDKRSNKVAIQSEKQGEEAGQPFGEGRRHDNKAGFGEDKEYEDVGGFSILRTHAPLYKKIWLKYGHIPSTKVMPISLYPILVMVVKDLMNCISDMHQCRYVELSSETFEHWEDMIGMAEKNEFNIGWLRERLETVKKGMGGMQNVTAELLEHGKPLRAAKDKLKILRNVMEKVEVQLIEAKANVRENTCGLLSESDLEMYLEIGENLLLDGLF
ncbi:hypothetical protein MKX01_038461 [Papaver californicum]|nr:hypothetical protein MKX01_038461 [Papaver californicum]